ncbi:phage adaptor protein [Acinetobacter entericus]|uniref:Uncharacterized protein n=1 Tax=Acinetobacter entericus TaxID=2989714 RepID=A0ABT3NEI0_9GAMM|nr:hypothetical protein [Acinetobacter entericus]MCW8037945.1 hypothetical protein [Acinetobacter entericus]
MKLSELLRRFRVEANDKVQPYFNEDEDVIAWLNEAVEEACIRGRLIHEMQNPDVCRIAVSQGNSLYSLHESLYEISFLAFDYGDGRCARGVEIVSPEYLDRCFYDNWRTMQGQPQYAIQNDRSIQLVPAPDEDGSIVLNGYRLPLTAMQNDDEAPGDLFKGHHVHLVQWALHMAFSIPDTEFFDPNRAAIAEQKFTDYFGERPDADLRRMTREDMPQTVVPIMP